MDSIRFRCEVTLRWYRYNETSDWELRHLGYGQALASIWESEEDEDDTDHPYAWATFCAEKTNNGSADSVEEAKQAILEAMGIKVLTTPDIVV